MADRITQANVKSAFEYFCKAFGFKISTGFNPKTRKNDPGLALDYNSAYGGYTIVELNDQNTGESQPFGSMRISPGEFYRSLWFATRAADYAHGGHAGSAARARSSKRRR